MTYDLTGRRFGRLVALECVGSKKRTGRLWRCKCDCGNYTVVPASKLLNENTTSCGCKHIESMERWKTINKKHGLLTTNPRLYCSVSKHFEYMRKGYSSYSNWTLDGRYTNDSAGCIKFCMDVISLQPDMCARYETDKELDLDKDNCDEKVFSPECIKFLPRGENRGKISNAVVYDGVVFSSFCKKCGVTTTGRGVTTRDYGKYAGYSRYHHGGIHPELVQKANELIALYTKTLKIVKLLEDARRFASVVDVQKLLQTSNPESV